MAKHRVFVYGSLRHGYENNSYYLSPFDLLALHVETKLREFDMVSLGAFPGVISNGAFRVIGDLYEIDSSCLNRLDRLESNGEFYERRPVELLEHGTAWLYFLLPEFVPPFDGHESNPGVLREQNTVEWKPNRRG